MLESDEGVSVVIPTYNRGAIVHRAIQSALDQTLQPAEILVVDDCSSDNTCDLVAAWSERDVRIRLVRMDCNEGGSAARNRGIECAKGAFVAFLDSDDEWMAEHLGRKLALLKGDEAAGLAFGSFVLADGKKRTLRRCFPLDRDALEYLFLGRGDMRTSTFVGRRDRLLEVMFDADLMKHQDWDLVVNLARRSRVVVDAQPTAILHVSSAGRMSSKLNHHATSQFFQKNRQHVSRDGWILFATVMMEWTFRSERKSGNYSYYLDMVKGFDRKAHLFVRLISALLYVPRVGGRLFRAACRKYCVATAENRRAEMR